MSANSSRPLVNTTENRCSRVFQQERCVWAAEGPGSSDVRSPKRGGTWRFHNSLALWAMLFCLAWREQWLGLTSKRVSALPQLFPLHSFSYCSLSQLRVRAPNHLCTTGLYHCVSSEWCSVTHDLTNGCNSLLQKDSLLFAALPSAVSSIKSIIMSHPGWFCFSVMVISCEERFRALAWLLRSPEQDSFILGSPESLISMQLPSQSEAALCAQHLRALCSVGRSQLTLLMQTHCVHSHTERTESWLLCKSSWLILINATVLLVAGTGQSTNSYVPE